MLMPTDLEDDEVVIGTVDCDGYEDIRFFKQDLYDRFGWKRSDAQLQRIANVLAANIGSPEYDDGGCVCIEPENFNDCFEEMISDIMQDI